MSSSRRSSAVWGWVRTAAALILFNASLTFVSIWPTLRVRPTSQISLEAALLVCGLALAWELRRAPASRTALRLLTALWVCLIVARYLEVSTRALYGRSVSLYFDLQLLPDVGAMFAYVAKPWILASLIAGLLLIPLVLALPIRWALNQLNQVLAVAGVRRPLLAGALVVLAGGTAVRVASDDHDRPLVAAPVLASIVAEVGEFARDALGAERRPLPPAPSVQSDLALVKGADVVLLFVESYGMTSWERPEFQAVLADPRADLAAAIADTGRAVVTAAVESTTFGGESWLAHISLLSGTEVRDPERNRRLLAERRDTLVTTFARAGYRTIGVFPGLHGSWPEGRFFGFQRVYTAPDLDYKGPPFGWWDVTDQFVLARTDELTQEGDDGSPVFVFLPSISTHTPFTPVPPYQPDWGRLLTAAPYDDDDLTRAYDAVPDWSNLGPDYGRALVYMHTTLSGYLRRHASRDLVMIVLGDHQPPALVSGEGASWNVPVHVIASRPGVLNRLRGQGFRDGLEPSGPALARMDTLLPILLAAFGNTE
jgi:Sulfatase